MALALLNRSKHQYLQQYTVVMQDQVVLTEQVQLILQLVTILKIIRAADTGVADQEVMLEVLDQVQTVQLELYGPAQKDDSRQQIQVTYLVTFKGLKTCH